MASNEINKITTKHLQKINEEQGHQANKTDKKPQIEVFASNDVSALVDLKATSENLSVFENVKLQAVSSKDKETEVVETSQTPVCKITEEEQAKIDERFATEETKELLSGLTEKQLVQVAKLVDLPFGVKNIVQIAKLFNEKDIDKVVQNAEELIELSGGKENVYVMALTNDNYDKNAYVMQALNYDLTLRNNVLNGDLSIRSIEKITEQKNSKGEEYREREAYDLGTNTLSKIRYNKDSATGLYIASYEIRSTVNADGKMVSREFTKPSEVKGIYDVDVLTEEGNTSVSSAKVDENGKATVRKQMTSLDGTVTNYEYSDTPNGNRESVYTITDKDGNVLMNNTKSFTVVDENTFKSTFNDDSYTMTIKDNILTVVDDKNDKNTTQIDLSKIEGNKEAIIKVLKQMSGDQLIALSKSTDKLVGIDSVLESYYMPKDRSIHSGEDMFVVLHEEGHAKDYQMLDLDNFVNTFDLMISVDKDLKDTFEAEKKAFNSKFPDAQREHIDYFINTVTHYGGRLGGLKETVAESNALLETPRSNEILAIRTHYLQQYFPKTIAKLNATFNENLKK